MCQEKKPYDIVALSGIANHALGGQAAPEAGKPRQRRASRARGGQAHLYLKGERLIPTHWGTFDLGLHTWYEPVQRLLAAVEKEKVAVSTPCRER